MARNLNKYFKLNGKNGQFLDSAELNTMTYFDYLNRFEKVARNVFEWINLPKSMNADYLEKCLYYYFTRIIFSLFMQRSFIWIFR